MLFCPAALPLSRQTLTYTAGIIRRHRRQIGSPWRKLNPGQQALLVLAYLRKGDTFAELAAVVGMTREIGQARNGYCHPERRPAAATPCLPQ